MGEEGRRGEREMGVVITGYATKLRSKSSLLLDMVGTAETYWSPFSVSYNHLIKEKRVIKLVSSTPESSHPYINI